MHSYSRIRSIERTLTLQVSLEENSSTMQCVSHEIFYQRLDDKLSKNRSEIHHNVQLTMFIEDQFYNEAMEYLKIQSEKSSSDSREMECKLSQSQLKTLQERNGHTTKENCKHLTNLSKPKNST